jgi:hypothetical protein
MKAAMGPKAALTAPKTDFRYTPESGLKTDITPCPKGADIVAKVPKGVAANFPPKKETSDNRRSIGLQTGYQNRL